MPGIRDWWQITPTTRPSKRTSHAMVYDEARDKIILFGGQIGTSTRANDTWEWDPSTKEWTNLNASPAPSARSGHAMVYDSIRRKVILFGGTANGSNGLNDTWEFDPETRQWTQLNPPTRPSGRYWHGMVFDRTRGRVVLFGGTATGIGYGGEETWIFDPVAVQWTNVTGAVKPRSRYWPGLVYDSFRDKVLLFGGWTSAYDLWELDPATYTWTQLAPQGLPSYLPNVTWYDAARDKVVVEVGSTSSGWLLYEYDRDLNAFQQVTGLTQKPGGRTGYSVVYDTKRGRAILFGGYNSSQSSTMYDDMWEWWTKPGLVFATAQGRPIDEHLLGVILSGQTSAVVALDLWNGAGFPVSGVQVAPSGLHPGDTAEISLTSDPFVPEVLPVTFPGPFNDKAKIASLYVRLRAGLASKGERSFVLDAVAEAA